MFRQGNKTGWGFPTRIHHIRIVGLLRRCRPGERIRLIRLVLTVDYRISVESHLCRIGTERRAGSQRETSTLMQSTKSTTGRWAYRDGADLSTIRVPPCLFRTKDHSCDRVSGIVKVSEQDFQKDITSLLPFGRLGHLVQPKQRYPRPYSWCSANFDVPYQTKEGGQ